MKLGPSEELRLGYLHHSTKVESPHSGTWQVAKPVRVSWGWHRWKTEARCGKFIGHCYHAEGIVDWFCCERGKETDGMPAQKCIFCKGKIVK